MCGICGIINKNEPFPVEIPLIKRMINSLNHRGPDSAGYFRDNYAFLGQSRLSIIDINGGNQPIADSNDTLFIVFNGEIYNYRELRGILLKQKHHFKTDSDTEVILHAYEEWGTECFEYFNGQWAFAIWDSTKKELLIARDRMGIRPLYFTLDRNRFYFASEVKTLFCNPEIKRELDPPGIGETLTFWSPIDPHTVFAEVHQLPPGHFAVIRRNKMESKAYWRNSYPPKGRESRQNLNDNIDELKSLLIDSARLRFTRSDVPVGAYISGGIDSSVTASIVSKYTDVPLKTFSIRFEDSEFDEGAYQEVMSRNLHTEHQSITVGYSDIGRIFPEVVHFAERPILRTAPAPLFLLSKLVRDNGYKVVLTGEGSDEILGGYDLFKENRARTILSRHPNSPIKQKIFERLYPWMDRSPLNNPAFASLFLSSKSDPADPGFSHRSRWDTGAAMLRLLAPAFAAEIPQRIDNFIFDILPENFSGWDPLCRAQYLEIRTLLSGYILSAQGDRMLAAHSVEGRYPFLDHRLVEFSNYIPARHKLMFLDEKYILKKAFADVLPDAVINRPKQPYRAPDAASFFKEEPEWLSDLVSARNIQKAGIFQAKSVQKIMEKARRYRGQGMSNTDNMRICAIISTMLLYEQYIERPPYSPGRIMNTNIPLKVIDKTKKF